MSVCRTFAITVALVSIVLTQSNISHAADSNRYVGSAALTPSRTQRSDNQRFVLNGVLAVGVGHRSNSDARGRFRLKADLKARPDGTESCATPGISIFSNGFE